MRKTISLIASFLLLTALLNGGFWVGASKVFAAADDEITVEQSFLEALIAAGVDTNDDGKITQGEMAVPDRLDITGSDITDISGIGFAVNLTALTVIGTGITALPGEISNLTKLETLGVSNNPQLSGNGLPSSLWTMTTLTSLEMKMDDIDTLPEAVSGLTNLQELNLYKNRLTTLPDSIGSLTNLHKLNLQRNQITALPGSIGSLGSLAELTVWENNLSSLPDSIGDLTTLTELDLNSNQLEILPASIANLVNLTSLKLAFNYLTALPVGLFDNMKALKTLDVEYNYLDPQSGSADRVETDKATANGAVVSYPHQNSYAVTLNFNGGTGTALAKPKYYYGESFTLPPAQWSGHAFGGWDSDGDGAKDKDAGDVVTLEPNPLTTPLFSYEAIFGYTVTFKTQHFGTIDGDTVDIPQYINAGDRITAVPGIGVNTGYVSLGWFDGQTPVTEADIKAMNLTSSKTFTAKFEAIGTIHFPDPKFMAALIASGVDDNADGFITDDEMKARTSIVLSGGQFTDIRGIGQATNLEKLQLGAGSVAILPDELGSLTSLKELDISGNLISTLPTWLWSMTGLVKLDIANLGLGSLPGGIAALANLQTLDISGNKLTTLPSGCFAAMTGLTALDLSNNYFNPNNKPAGTPVIAVMLPQKTYTITLDFKGGKGQVLPKSGYYYGEAISLPIVTKTGYEFDGWDTNADGNANTIGAGTVSLLPVPPESITSKCYTAIYKSSNARLSGIGLSAGAYLKPAFNPAVYSYTVTLYDYVGSVTITPVKSDTKATMLINNVKSASIPVSLSSASVTRDISVSLTAENGRTKLTYTIHVVRAPVIDLGLSSVTLTAGVTRSPVFSKTTLAYTVLVPATMGNVTLAAVRVNATTSVYVDGVAALSKVVSIGQGLTKTVSVVVKSPLTTDKTKTYTFMFKRGTIASGFTASPKVGTAYTLSPGGTNRMTFSYTMGGPGTVKLEIYKGGKWLTLMTRTEPSAGVKTWAWDGKVAGVFLPVAIYQVRITPYANGVTGASTILPVKIVTYPTVTWKTIASTFRANGVIRTLCVFKVNYPTNVAVQVYNSKGKIAATVKTITNLLPSSTTYNTVTWNGRATSGNTAGLSVGALVPTGTYTVRITTGSKVYTKTIKITR